MASRQPVDLITADAEQANLKVNFDLGSAQVKLDKNSWEWVEYALEWRVKDTEGYPSPQYTIKSDGSAISVGCSAALQSRVTNAFRELDDFFGRICGLPSPEGPSIISKPGLYISAVFPEEFWPFEFKVHWTGPDNKLPDHWDITNVMSRDELVRYNRENPKVRISYANDYMAMIVGAPTQVLLDETKAKLGNMTFMKQKTDPYRLTPIVRHHLNAEGYTEANKPQPATSETDKADFYVETRHLSNIQTDLPKMTFLDEEWKPKDHRTISYKSMYESGVSIRICKLDEKKGFRVSLLGPKIQRPSIDQPELPRTPLYNKTQDLSWTPPPHQVEKTKVIPKAIWITELLKDGAKPKPQAPRLEQKKKQNQNQQQKQPNLMDEPIASPALDDRYPALEEERALVASKGAGASAVHDGDNQADLIDFGAEKVHCSIADEPSLPVRVYQTMNQQAPSTGPSRRPMTFPLPDRLQKSLGLLIDLGPYVCGQVSLRLDLGRVVMLAHDGAAVAYNNEDAESNGYTCDDILKNILNHKTFSGDSYDLVYHFTRILTTSKIDASIMSRATHNGLSLWDADKPEGTSRVYSFLCKPLEKGNSCFIVDISGSGDDHFSFIIRSPEDIEESITIHHVCRNWDSQFRFTHSNTNKLLEDFGVNGQMLLHSFWVQTKSPNSGFGFALREPKFHVLDVRINLTARWLSPDKRTALTIAKTTKFKTSRQGQDLGGWTQYKCHLDEEKAGRPNSWFQASITSTILEDKMNKNRSLGCGEMADWGSPDSTIQGLRDIWNQGTRMVATMDSIGALNDNHLKGKYGAPRPNNAVGTRAPPNYQAHGW